MKPSPPEALERIIALVLVVMWRWKMDMKVGLGTLKCLGKYPIRGYRTPTVPTPNIIARKIVDDLEAVLEPFRETVKSSIWIPGQGAGGMGADREEFQAAPHQQRHPGRAQRTR